MSFVVGPDGRDAACGTWDVVVVGAGPAGALAAHQLARAGVSVLVVERRHFPRAKVCGSCFGPAAIAALEAAGLEHVLDHAAAYRHLRLASGKRRAVIDVPEGRALARESFDAALLDAAAAVGARVLLETVAELVPTAPWAPTRALHLRRRDEAATVQARVVLACDGLGGAVLDQEPGMRLDVARQGRIGVGTIAPAGWLEDAVDENTVTMSCAAGGYAGMVRLADGHVALATALHPRFLREHGSPARAVAAILGASGLRPAHDLEHLEWRGTPLLTRRRSRLGGHRVLAVGDSAGYVEPFTGDGIAWALSGALAVAGLALAGVQEWRPDLLPVWEALHRRLLHRRQRLCGVLGWILDRPHLASLSVAALRGLPRLSRPLTALLARPIGHVAY